jgi:hypothetical protein
MFSSTMVLFRTDQGAVSSSEGSMFKMLGPNALGLVVVLENLDPTNYVSYRFMYATVNSGLSFTQFIDGSGTFGSAGTLTPTGGPTPTALVTLLSTANYIELLASASGGVTLRWSILQVVPTPSTGYTSGTQ